MMWALSKAPPELPNSMRSSATRLPTRSADLRTSGWSSSSSRSRRMFASDRSVGMGSIRQHGLDGSQLGLGISVGLVGLSAGAAVPVAGVGGVALDLVQHRVHPAERRI